MPLSFEETAEDPVWVKAKEQVARLETKEGFPFSAPPKRDMCIALTTCESLEEMEQVIDDFVFNETRCPDAGDIRRKIFDAHDQRNSTAAREAERTTWKREQSHPVDQLSRLKKSGDPLLDRHLELLVLRMQEMTKLGRAAWHREPDGRVLSVETDITRELNEIARKWRPPMRYKPEAA